MLSRYAGVATPEKAQSHVLLREERFDIQDAGSATHRIHMLLRPLTSGGVETWSIINAGWQPWREEMPSLRARVIGKDGRVSVLDPAKIIDQQAGDDENNLRSDSRRISAPVPNLEIGSILEFFYEARFRQPLPGAGIGRIAILGGSNHTLYESFACSYPKGMALKVRSEGIAIERSEEGGKSTITASVRDYAPVDPALHSLPFDVAPWPLVAFSTADSWESVTEAYRKASDPAIDAASMKEYARRALGGIDPAADPVGAIRAIAKAVSRDVRYTGVYFGENAILPHPAAESLALGYGDCKDQASILAACLRAVGIDASLALLIAGRGFDQAPDVPSLDFFNHAIVRVIDPPMWVDPTYSFAPAGELSPSVAGRRALVIREGEAGLERIPEADPAGTLYEERVSVRLTPRGGSEVVETTRVSGTIGADYRSSFASNPRDKTIEHLVSYAKKTYKADSASADHGDPFAIGEPFELSVRALDSGICTTSDESARVLLKAGQAFDFLPSEWSNEKLDESGRKQPVRVGRPHVARLSYNVTPAPGFRLAAVPEPWEVEYGPARFSASFSETGGGGLAATYELRLAPGAFDPETYRAFKAWLISFFDSEAASARFEFEPFSLRSRGKRREAYDAALALAKAYPAEAFYQVQLSEALFDAGFVEDALVAAEAAARMDPGYSEATSNIAWLSLHDPFGRQLKEGCDAARAKEAYLESFKQNPKAFGALFNAAILSEFNDTFVLRGKGAPLEEAVALYERAQSEIAEWGYGERYCLDLFELGRYADIVKYNRGLKDRTVASGYALAALCMLEGLDASLKEAAKISADAQKRRSAYSKASQLLLSRRSYAEASALMIESARGTTSFASTSGTAKLFASMRRYESIIEGDGDIEPLFRIMEYILELGDAQEEGLRTAFGYTEEELNESISGLSEQIAALKAQLSQSGLSGYVVLDLLASLAQVRKVTIGAFTFVEFSLESLGVDDRLIYFLWREGGGAARFGAEASPQAIAVWIGMQAKAGRRDTALAFVEALRAAKDKLRGMDDPLGGKHAAAYFAANPSPDPALLALHIALDAGAARQFFSSFADEIKGLRDAEGIARYPLRIALSGAIPDPAEGKKLALEAYEALKGVEKELARRAAVSAIYRSQDLGDFGGLDSMIAAVIAENPGDTLLLTLRAEVLRGQNRIEESFAAYDAIIKSGKATSLEYNNAAWSLLFGEAPDYSYIEKWGLAKRLEAGNSAEIHTLVCLLAARGDYDAARSAFDRYLDKPGATTGATWFAHGLLAMSFGLPERARSSLEKAIELSDEEDASSIPQLSRLFLARLK